MSAPLLRRTEAAAYLKVGRTTLDLLVREGELAVVETRGGRRYRQEDLEAYVWKRRVPAKADREQAGRVARAPLPIAVPDGLIDIFTGLPFGQGGTGAAATKKARRRG